MVCLKRLLAVLLGLAAFGPSMLAQEHPPNGNTPARVSPTDTSLGPIQFDTRGVEFGPFNDAAFDAITRSSPTMPLPDAYPDSQAKFTVTFSYNEDSPDQKAKSRS